MCCVSSQEDEVPQGLAWQDWGQTGSPRGEARSWCDSYSRGLILAPRLCLGGWCSVAEMAWKGFFWSVGETALDPQEAVDSHKWQQRESLIMISRSNAEWGAFKFAPNWISAAVYLSNGPAGCVCLRQWFILLWCCSLIPYATCWLLWKFGPVLENFQYSIVAQLCRSRVKCRLSKF